MCGVAGILARDRRAIPAHALSAMNGAMVHRGPDEEGSFYDQGVALGIRRLRVIDLPTGQQPIHNESKSVHVVMNGEIYNYRALRRVLEAKGHTFYTESDTEVVVHSYEEQGRDFVRQLRGMFAIALYDSRLRTLVLARDRVGKKPLYYAQGPHFLVFASEIKALHASGLLEKRPNLGVLGDFLSHGFVPGEQTLFCDVKKLPAGTILCAHGQDLAITPYWNVPTRPVHPTPAFPEAVNEVRRLLEEAVRIRLVSDVPLGMFLSGGIDSAAILGLMAGLSHRPVQAFTIDFGSHRNSEAPSARVVARHVGAELHEIRMESCTPELLECVNRHHDEPAVDPATVPTLQLARFAKEKVTVVLTGEGGDELFAGYDHYRRYRNLLAIERAVPFLPPLARAVGNGLQALNGHIYRRVEKGCWLTGLPQAERYRGWHAILTDAEKKTLLRPELFAPAVPSETCDAFQECLREAAALSPLNRFLYIDAKLSLAEQLLVKVDKMTMAASLEARCPLLDQELFDFVSPLPERFKITPRETKILFRRAVADLIPRATLERPKQGFEVPLRHWLLSDLKELSQDLLLGDHSTISSYVDAERVRRMWTQLRHRADHLLARQLWLLLNFAVWHRVHWN